MARRPSSAARTTTVLAFESDPNPPQIVPEGDFAGMTYDEVMRLTSEAIDVAYGPLSIEGVLAVHDMKTVEILEVALDHKGEAFAHEAALKLGMSLMPYLSVPEAKIQKAYGELAKLRPRIKGRN